MEDFRVVYRNFGHWDILTNKEGRMFRIRGGPGKYIVLDGRSSPSVLTPFKTVGACMAYITDILMFELIVAEGQSPTIIESWNV